MMIPHFKTDIHRQEDALVPANTSTATRVTGGRRSRPRVPERHGAVVIYRHTQAGTLIRWLVGLSSAFLAANLVFAPAHPVAIGVIVGVLAILLTCLVLFHCLTTTVTSDAVVVAFGPGWIRRSVPLRSVRAARTVRNPVWYGWGLRLTPHGWLYNVSGRQAVELDLADGTRLRIGTDEPQRLQTAIEQAARFGR